MEEPKHLLWERRKTVVLDIINAFAPETMASVLAEMSLAMRADGMSDEDIRVMLNEACANLGIDRRQGLN